MSPHTIINNDREYNDPVTKANIFNSYFHSVFSKQPPPVKKTANPAPDPNLSYILVDEKEVHKILTKLETSKAIGPDGIPSKILKDFADELTHPITELFNQSLTSGKVPSDWKRANIIPVYKKEDRRIVKNYRPISLLPVISKVLERCIYNKIIEFIKPKITKDQYGFQLTGLLIHNY